VATVTSSTYTVSAAGTAAETITNVPYYTPKTTFLAALARGQFNQTWNDAGIANPVMPGNRLIVTAQDGATAVTYTVSVNAAPPVTGGGYYPPAAPAPVSTPVTTSGFNPAALMLNDKGLVKGDVLLVAKAQDITLLIPDGTRMLNAQGLPLTSLTAKPVTDVPYSPPSASVALMYDFGPNGSTFDPPLKLSIPFKAAEAGDALIAYWDGSRWIALATSFDTASAQLTAKISHFTLFGVIVANKAVVPPEPVKTPDNPGISVVVTPAKPGLPVLTPSITQDPVVTPAQTLVPLQTPVIPQTSLAPTPAAMEKNGGGFAWYWGLIIGIVVGLLAMWVLTWRRRSAQKNKG
jgi:hypothetical protein